MIKRCPLLLSLLTLSACASSAPAIHQEASPANGPRPPVTRQLQNIIWGGQSPPDPAVTHQLTNRNVITESEIENLGRKEVRAHAGNSQSYNESQREKAESFQSGEINTDYQPHQSYNDAKIDQTGQPPQPTNLVPAPSSTQQSPYPQYTTPQSQYPTPYYQQNYLEVPLPPPMPTQPGLPQQIQMAPQPSQAVTSPPPNPLPAVPADDGKDASNSVVSSNPTDVGTPSSDEDGDSSDSSNTNSQPSNPEPYSSQQPASAQPPSPYTVQNPAATTVTPRSQATQQSMDSTSQTQAYEAYDNQVEREAAKGHIQTQMHDAQMQQDSLRAAQQQAPAPETNSSSTSAPAPEPASNDDDSPSSSEDTSKVEGESQDTCEEHLSLKNFKQTFAQAGGYGYPGSSGSGSSTSSNPYGLPGGIPRAPQDLNNPYGLPGGNAQKTQDPNNPAGVPGQSVSEWTSPYQPYGLPGNTPRVSRDPNNPYETPGSFNSLYSGAPQDQLPGGGYDVSEPPPTINDPMGMPGGSPLGQKQGYENRAQFQDQAQTFTQAPPAPMPPAYQEAQKNSDETPAPPYVTGDWTGVDTQAQLDDAMKAYKEAQEDQNSPQGSQDQEYSE